ncbi:MAG: hypothetical protein ACXWYV_12060 [Solirubrobacterales bacterium]
MESTKLSRSELLGIVCAVILVGSLFLEWYSLDTEGVERDLNDPGDWVCGEGNNSCSGFDTFPILRWLLIAAASAPLILSYIVVREKSLSWPRGEMTAVVGLTAFVLIAYNGLIDTPSQNDLGVNLSYGYVIALLASLGIFLAGGYRSVESGGGARRKPPATF